MLIGSLSSKPIGHVSFGRDATNNNHAEWMLKHDINNMLDYYDQLAPERLTTQYVKEVWTVYEPGERHSDKYF